MFVQKGLPSFWAVLTFCMFSSLCLIIYSIWFCSERYMTLSFTWTVGGHCKFNNCPNFHTIVTQGLGRPKERERGMAWWWISQSTHSIYQVSSLIWALFIVPPISLVTSEVIWSQITITNKRVMKKSEVSWVLSKYDIGMKWANVDGKIAPVDFLVATDLQFVRKEITCRVQ